MAIDSLATTAKFTTRESAEWALRVDLAAAFRLAVEFDWHESVGNHFSASVSADGRQFLMNPRWKHFSTVRASDLQLLDADDRQIMERSGAPDPSAWCIHGAVHRQVPEARVLLHCHPPYTTTLATLKDPTLLPIDQNTARFHGLVGVDLAYGGLADNDAEGARIAAALNRHPILLMGNHGISVTAPTVAEAFEHLYFFERASRTLILAYSTCIAHGIETAQCRLVPRKQASNRRDVRITGVASRVRVAARQHSRDDDSERHGEHRRQRVSLAMTAQDGGTHACLLATCGLPWSANCSAPPPNRAPQDSRTTSCVSIRVTAGSTSAPARRDNSASVA